MLARILTALILAGFLLASPPQLQGQATLEETFSLRLRDKVVTLRGFSRENKLEYDATGTPKKTYSSGSWTIYGAVRIESVRLRKNRLEIRGRRGFIAYNENNKRLEFTSRGRKVEILVESGSQADEAQLQKALARVFLAGDDQLAETVPDHWQYFLRQYNAGLGIGDCVGKSAEPMREDVLKFGDSTLNPPRLKRAPDPKYPSLAQNAGVQGTTTLCVIVDRRGQLTDIRVQTPFGFGFEEAAIEAVQRWEFDPATRNGEPVAIQIAVQVNFRLH